MARTKATRRRPPHRFYAARARTAAQVAARLPPSRRQFEEACDYYDEPTVLDYLRLTPSIPRDMEETNAYIAELGHPPPPRAPWGASEDPYLWFWPFRNCALFAPTTLFTFAARYAFADVVAWLFCAREQVARIGATLTHVFYDTLTAAVVGRHLDIIEMLLTSPVFLEMLSLEEQQEALDDALYKAEIDAVCQLLVGHGATASLAEPQDMSWASVRCQAARAGPAAATVGRTVWRGASFALERDLHGAVVAGHAVLIRAVKSGDAEAVELLLSHGFIDVDARTSDGLTALIVCGSVEDRYKGDHARECKREIVHYLLEAGADTTLRDPDGHTALHVAIVSGSLACVEALLEHTVVTSGTKAVHGDVEALMLAFRERDRFGGHSQRVLMALLERGACSCAYQRMLETGDLVADVCANPSGCRLQIKRKRVTQGEEEDDEF